MATELTLQDKAVNLFGRLIASVLILVLIFGVFYLLRGSLSWGLIPDAIKNPQPGISLER